MNPLRMPLAVLLGAASLAGAGCFSERQMSATAPEDPCTQPAQEVTVEIRDYAFHPAEACVTRGGRVIWINRDAEPHSSTADDGAWDSGLVASGSRFSQSFDEAGRFGYFCVPHPFMKGVVIVQ